MNKPWSHLPNAAHIDRVLDSLKAHPDMWNAARDAAWDVTYEAWNAAWNAARIAARDAARIAARNATRDAAWDATRDAAYYAARGSILALVAYDNAAKYLNMPVDQLKMWAILSEEPAAILLLPAVIAFEQISELEMV
jgi:hypothetical protein